jgi:hypothetical protein
MPVEIHSFPHSKKKKVLFLKVTTSCLAPRVKARSKERKTGGKGKEKRHSVLNITR